MTKAIMLYTGNVASTPTIEYVRTSGKVLVPVVEQFDRHDLDKHFPGQKDLFGFLVRVLTQLFEGRMDDFFERPGLAARIAGVTPADVPHLFFKWRPFHQPGPALDAFVELMEVHAVKPVVIRRRSVIEQALKVYLSETAYGGRHQQFKAGKMSDADYAAYIAEQETLRITVDEAGMAAIEEICRRFLHRSQKLLAQRDALFPRSRDAVVVTEDIYTPEVDKPAFERIFSEIFEDEIRIDVGQKILTRKAGLNVENCANYDAVLANPTLRALQDSYDALAWSR